MEFESNLAKNDGWLNNSIQILQFDIPKTVEALNYVLTLD